MVIICFGHGFDQGLDNNFFMNILYSYQVSHISDDVIPNTKIYMVVLIP